MYKMLLATDFSDASLNAYRYCLSLTSEVRSEVHIVHVYRHGAYAGFTGAGQRDAQDRAYAAFLERTRRFSRLYPNITDPKILQQVAVEVEVTEGQATQRLISLAKEDEVDLLIIGSKAHPGIFRRMFGHLAKGLIYGAPVPILVVPEECTAQQPKRAVIIAGQRSEEQRLLAWMDGQSYLGGVERKCCLLPTAQVEPQAPEPGHPDQLVHLTATHLPHMLREIEAVHGDLVLIELPGSPDLQRDQLIHYLYDHLAVPMVCLHEES